MSIPAAFEGMALQAVASQDRRVLTDVAQQLGLSIPTLVSEALGMAHDPDVIARHPRPSRVLRERQEAGREARSAQHLGVRADV